MPLITHAYRKLTFGQMLRPPALEVATVTADIFRRAGTVQIPRIMHSAWRGTSGRIGYALVNWTTTPEHATLSLIEDNRGPTSSELYFVNGKGRALVPRHETQTGKIEVTVPALSVLLVEEG